MKESADYPFKFALVTKDFRARNENFNEKKRKSLRAFRFIVLFSYL